MVIGSDIVDVIVRTVVVYLAIVLGLLFLGRKELSQLSIPDLVFILLISNSVQNAMVGNNSTLEGGLVAATALLLLNFLFRWLNFRYSIFRKYVAGEPVLLIYEGKVKDDNLYRTKITHEELMTALREHGVDKIEEVSLAMLEADGNISIISHELHGKTYHKRRRKAKVFMK